MWCSFENICGADIKIQVERCSFEDTKCLIVRTFRHGVRVRKVYLWSLCSSSATSESHTPGWMSSATNMASCSASAASGLPLLVSPLAFSCSHSRVFSWPPAVYVLISNGSVSKCCELPPKTTARRWMISSATEASLDSPAPVKPKNHPLVRFFIGVVKNGNLP